MVIRQFSVQAPTSVSWHENIIRLLYGHCYKAFTV